MKHKIAALAAAGALFAMTGAAHAIAPAAAAGLVFLGHAAAGEAIKAEQQQAASVPSTTVLGAPATVHVTPTENGVQIIESSTYVVPAGSGLINYDHDGDGVLNHNDRFPNDGTRS